MGDVLKALQRNEEVTLLRRGKPVAVIRPIPGNPPRSPVVGHKAFGMWADRPELADVGAAMERIRKGRFDAL